MPSFLGEVVAAGGFGGGVRDWPAQVASRWRDGLLAQVASAAAAAAE